MPAGASGAGRQSLVVAAEVMTLQGRPCRKEQVASSFTAGGSIWPSRQRFKQQRSTSKLAARVFQHEINVQQRVPTWHGCHHGRPRHKHFVAYKPFQHANHYAAAGLTWHRRHHGGTRHHARLAVTVGRLHRHHLLRVHLQGGARKMQVSTRGLGRWEAGISPPSAAARQHAQHSLLATEAKHMPSRRRKRQ